MLGAVPMRDEQFSAIAELKGLHKGPALTAAFRHCVNGDRVVDAARIAGCSTQSAHNCIARIKKALELAKVAAWSRPQS